MVCAYGACNAARCSLHKCMHCDWMGKGGAGNGRTWWFGRFGFVGRAQPKNCGFRPVQLDASHL